MPTPGEHKTVQARILKYAEAIGWTIVSREEAEQRRGFDPEVPPADRAKNRSLFFDDLFDANPTSSVDYVVTGVLEVNTSPLIWQRTECQRVSVQNQRFALWGSFDCGSQNCGKPQVRKEPRYNPRYAEGFLLRSASYGGQDGETGLDVEHLRYYLNLIAYPTTPPTIDLKIL